MPKIVWPQQPERIREAWLRHHEALPDGLAALLDLPEPPPMAAEQARAFLRTFYAARDLDRAERDLAAGGDQTDSFAGMTLRKRVTEFERRMFALQAALQPAAASPIKAQR
jgi:hypothetical protein